MNGKVSRAVNALKDDNWRVRVKAAQALGHIGDPSAVPALIEALNDVNEEVADFAAKALGNFADVRAAGALIAKIEGDMKQFNDVTELAYIALESLEQMGGKVIPEIEGSLKSKSPTVRRLLIDVLGKMGEAAVPALGRALKSDFYDLPGLAENALFRMDVDLRRAKAAAAKAPLKHDGPTPMLMVKPMGSRPMPVPGNQAKATPRKG